METLRGSRWEITLENIKRTKILTAYTNYTGHMYGTRIEIKNIFKIPE